MGKETTLVKTIRAIAKVPDSVGIDKKKEIREEFEKLKEKNTVVQRVFSGETTFSKEYEILLSEYDSVKDLIIPYDLPDGFEESVIDLERCIGSAELNDSLAYQIPTNIVANMTFFAALASLTMGRNDIKEVKKRVDISRREMMKIAGKVGGLWAMIGALPPMFYQVLGLQRFDTIESNAAYLDNLYNNLYKNNPAYS